MVMSESRAAVFAPPIALVFRIVRALWRVHPGVELVCFQGRVKFSGTRQRASGMQSGEITASLQDAQPDLEACETGAQGGAHRRLE